MEDYDDETMAMVYMALMESGLTHEQAVNAINSMQNAGILFRERGDD